MRRISAILVLFVLLLIATSSVALAQGFDTEDEAPQPEFAPDQLLVRFQPTTTAQGIDQILATHGATRIRHLAALDVHTLRLPPGLSVEQAVKVFSRLPEVAFAEPNYILRILAQPAVEVIDQWGLNKIQAPDAWTSLGQTPPPVLLAIVDTGVDRTHPDLSANIWQNPGEIANNGSDDDGNGYVDDTWGWDFYNGDNDPDDDHFHGTAVSSVAAAVRDNSGLAGVCPWCEVVPVKVLGADGSGSLDTVANGIIYAADIGARVVNLSLGGIIGSQTLQNAVDYAWGQGALVVAAAGNNGADARLWPAAYANSMAIAATNEQDYRSYFSNFGNFGDIYISVAAPGEAIISAVPGGGYGTYSGTSLAAPHVSGLGGLLFSQNAARTNADVRAIIETTTNDLGPVGTDPYFGTGRINAYRAVTGDTSPTDPPAGLFTDDLTASGYPHARKLARDATGALHLVWHGKDGGQYRVLYATSSDGGANWSPPQVVFESLKETFHPALAVDGGSLYVAFPSQHNSSTYRILFTKRPLAGGSWSTPVALMGGPYHTVRPDLYIDPSNGKLHLAASSLDDAPYIYYTSSGDAGESWGPVRQVNAGYQTRYAAVHASGPNIYIAGRTVEFILFGLLPRYRVFTIRSSNDGDSWGDKNELAVHDGLYSGEYGVSLAGIGERLYLSYEHNGSIYFRRSEGGVAWSAAETIGAGAWSSLTQGNNGQAWLILESGGSLSLRHYTGSAWDAPQTLSTGYYPNLKLGTNGGFVEWAATHPSGAPFRLVYDSRASGANNAPLAGNDDATTDEDTPVVIAVLANDNDPDADPLTVTNLTQPANGTATLNPDNTVTYAPASNFSDSDSFTYTANDGTVDSNIAIVSITVNPVNDPPIATFSYTCADLACDFDASASSDPDGSIVSYSWNFGDGNTGSGATASHTFAAAGSYSVILTVTDDGGAAGADTQSVTVTEPPPMHLGDLDGASLNNGKNWQAQVTITVHDGSHQAVAGATVSGDWSGDGSGSSSCTTGASGACTVTSGNIPKKGSSSVIFTVNSVEQASFTYSPADNHDPEGDSSGTAIQVNKDGSSGDPGAPANQPPVASFSYTCPDLSCSFDASGSSDPDGSIVTYAWNFGDGNSGSGVTAGHTYAAPGTYSVVLSVTDDGGATGSETQNVTVSAGSGGLTLTASGYKVKGVQHADLVWSGAGSAEVDIYRNGANLGPTANDGFYTDNIGNKGGGSYTYRVCEAGTSTCSNEATVTF